MRSVLDKIYSFLLSLSKTRMVLLLTILLAILAVLDFTTGYEITFSLLYLLPISLAAWFLDAHWGYFFNTVSMICWVYSNFLAGQVYSNNWIWVWNISIRFTVFSVIVLFLNELKLTIKHEHLIASTDSLTGIWNSREFHRIAEIEIHRARRFKQPITIAYIDLDNFKTVNDKRGHAEGDKLLASFAHTVSNIIRKTDIFARVGGDEFIILFPGTDSKQAAIPVNKLKETICSQMKKRGLSVTCSIGMITFKTPPKTVKDLVSKADKLMYKSKTTGKNKIIIDNVS